MLHLPSDSDLDVPVFAAESQGNRELYPFRSITNCKVGEEVGELVQTFRFCVVLIWRILIRLTPKDVLAVKADSYWLLKDSHSNRESG